MLSAAPTSAASHIREPADIPMRDGQSLAADVYLPAPTGSWPVVLIQTPYNKNTFAPVFLYDLSDDPLLKNTNYAFVVLDWRGFFGSIGALYPGAPSRGEDGYDAVEWVAIQPWCDGNVGTWGASALGNVQLKTAAEQPPHLRACVPLVYHYREQYALCYPGGVYARNRNEYVYSIFGGLQLVRANPLYNEFWVLAEAAARFDQINVPMLHITGWYDHETAATIAEMQKLQDTGGPGARGTQKLLIGPWTHGAVGGLEQGQLEYPAAEFVSSRAAVEFFDFYLRGIANDYPAQPVVRYFHMNEDRWSGSPTWPPPSAESRILYFQSDNSLNDAPPNETQFVAYPADPADAVPTVFGAVVDEAVAQRGPGDLRILESRPDVLTFTSPLQTCPLAIAGAVQVQAYLSVETPGAVDTDLVVRLTDVYPDGRSMLLVDGARRASLRDGYESREFLNPGQIVPVEISLPPVAVTLPVDHRLRLMLAPSNYDLFDVNMQDGSDLSDDPGAAAVSATIRFWTGPDCPARVILPITPRPGDLDADCDVDLDDASIFAGCVAGPGQDPFTGCDPVSLARADLAGDGDVDLADFATFQLLFGQP